MTTELRDALHALAGHEPVAAPPSDLWDRGVRRLRRRRAAAAGVALAVLAVGGATGAVVADAVRTDAGQFVSDGDEGAIPDQLDTPSPWMSDTDDAGPIGPLAVVAGAERKAGVLGESSNGVVGVSAETGEYRFLDLPGRLESSGVVSVDDPPALSPDGRWVAYWLRGEADGTAVASGVAAYDTVTGEVVRRPVDAPKGVQPELLSWAGDDQVVVEYSTITSIELREDGSSTSSIVKPALLWSPASGDEQEVEGLRTGVAPGLAPTDAGFASLPGRRLTLWRAGERVATHPLGKVDLASWGITADAGRVGGLTQESERDLPELLVGAVPDGAGPVELEALRTDPELRPWVMLGWRDDTHLLVEAYVKGDQLDSYGVYAVDTTTGEAELLVRERQVNWDPGHSFASDLWERDTVERPGPDSVLDPRLSAAIGGAGALALAAGAVFLVRRRRAQG